jgi:hypothetical protein
VKLGREIRCGERDDVHVEAIEKRDDPRPDDQRDQEPVQFLLLDNLGNIDLLVLLNTIVRADLRRSLCYDCGGATRKIVNLNPLRWTSATADVRRLSMFRPFAQPKIAADGDRRPFECQKLRWARTLKDSASWSLNS